MKYGWAIFLPILLSACASLQSVSLTPIPAERSNKIELEASKVVVLGFNFDNDFVDSLTRQLASRCPNGKVSGILTKDEVIDYFLFFVWKRKVSVTGYCSGAVAHKASGRRGTASDGDETASEKDNL